MYFIPLLVRCNVPDVGASLRFSQCTPRLTPFDFETINPFNFDFLSFTKAEFDNLVHRYNYLSVQAATVRLDDLTRDLIFNLTNGHVGVTGLVIRCLLERLWDKESWQRFRTSHPREQLQLQLQMQVQEVEMAHGEDEVEYSPARYVL